MMAMIVVGNGFALFPAVYYRTVTIEIDFRLVRVVCSPRTVICQNAYRLRFSKAGISHGYHETGLAETWYARALITHDAPKRKPILIMTV
jgi:hypothetical protein